ncbi:hypothetical protein ACFL1D_00750 [Candidatus Omnitrophota bacterium]
MSLTELIKAKKVGPNQIVSLALLALACLIAINIYQKQSKKITQVEQLYQEQNKKNAVLLRIGDIMAGIKVYQERLQSQDIRQIINKITDIARSSKIDITAIKPQAQTSQSKSKIYDKTFFEVSLSADGYHELGEFISRLENDPIVFVVESLTLNRGTDLNQIQSDTTEVKLKARLIISQLFFID